jgi:hypothetical protein
MPAPRFRLLHVFQNSLLVFQDSEPAGYSLSWGAAVFDFQDQPGLARRLGAAMDSEWILYEPEASGSGERPDAVPAVDAVDGRLALSLESG